MDFILIHGAGTGGWLWQDVAERLRRKVHPAWTPSLSGVGERAADGGPHTDLSTHVAEVNELIRREGASPAITLVGFSYGGLVAGVLAAAAPDRIARLIYLDGFVPQPGRSMLDALSPDMAAQLQELADTTGDGWRLPPLPLARVGGIGPVADGIDPAVIEETLNRRGPHPIGTYREPSPVQREFPVERTLFISCTAKPPDDPTLRIAAGLRAAGVSVVEIDSGHFAILTMPDQLVRLLLV